jgi:hypothetical protein
MNCMHDIVVVVVVVVSGGDGGGGRMRNEELHDLYYSPNTVKSERWRMAAHVVRMGEISGVYRVWWGNLRERDHLEDLGAFGRTKLRWIL